MNVRIRELPRDVSKAQLYYFLNQASQHDNLWETIVDCFYLRDPVHGRGERRLGRLCFNWLADTHPAIFLKLLPLIPRYGRWDDLLYITQSNIRPIVHTFVFNQLHVDMLHLRIGLPISECAKWLPTEGKAYARRFQCEFFGLLQGLRLTPKEYRVTLSSLRPAISSSLSTPSSPLSTSEGVDEEKYYAPLRSHLKI